MLEEKQEREAFSTEKSGSSLGGFPVLIASWSSFLCTSIMLFFFVFENCVFWSEMLWAAQMDAATAGMSELFWKVGPLALALNLWSVIINLFFFCLFVLLSGK